MVKHGLCNDDFVKAVAPPPLGLDAGDAPVPPNGPALHQLTRDTPIFRTHLAATILVAGIALPCVHRCGFGRQRLAAGEANVAVVKLTLIPPRDTYVLALAPN